MRKLANISQFESLMNERALVENGWLGNKIADSIFANPNTTKKNGNRANYEAVMQKAAGVMQNPSIPPDVKNAIHNGFEQFARFCYNIKTDLTDSIRLIRVMQHKPDKRDPAAAGGAFGNKIWIPMQRPTNKDGWQQILAGTVSHELMHALENCNRTVHTALLPKNMPFRRTVCTRHLFDENTAGGYYCPHINVRAKDRLRAWVANNPYAGVLGGRGQNISAPCSKKEILSKLNKINKKRKATWNDLASVVYEYMRENLFRDEDLEKIDQLINNPNPTSEYLTSFMSGYQARKIPLLYALDVKRLINKINRMAKKQQNGKTR